MVNLRVVAANHQIVAATLARKFKDVARITAMIRAIADKFAAAHFLATGAVRKFESFNRHVSRRFHQFKAARAGDFRAASRFSGNDNRLARRSPL